MAVPKRKMSRSNTRSRRAQWKTSAPTLVACSNRACGQPKLPPGAPVIRGERAQLDHTGKAARWQAGQARTCPAPGTGIKSLGNKAKAGGAAAARAADGPVAARW